MKFCNTEGIRKERWSSTLGIGHAYGFLEIVQERRELAFPKCVFLVGQLSLIVPGTDFHKTANTLLERATAILERNIRVALEIFKRDPVTKHKMDLTIDLHTAMMNCGAVPQK